MRGTRHTRRIGVAGLTAAAVLVIAATQAFTASNTVPGTKAGDGLGTITGYVVSSVAYTLNATDPTKIDAVSFTLDAAPAAGATIKAKLVSAGSTWYSCSATGTSVTCNTTSPQATVSSADELRVVAAS